jgi:glycerol-3-phosphate dehydrogenase
LAERYDLPSPTAQHLAQKFGTDSPKVLELAEKEPELLLPLSAGGAPIRAEAVHAIREEMAQSIEDILLRRIGVQFHGWKEAAEAAPLAGRLLAREFGWSDAQTREAVAAYLGSIQHLFDSAGLGS